MFQNTTKLALLIGPAVMGVACFPGGIIDRGGFSDTVSIVSSATLIRGAPYRIVCWDEAEAERRRKYADEHPEENEPAEGVKDGAAKGKSASPKSDGAKAEKAERPPAKDPGKPAAEERPGKKEPSGQVLGPPIRFVSPQDYQGGCEQEGEHSVFFLLNLFPVTPPLNPEYAISTAVQRLEGDTMVKIRIWHEVHYYSLLGRVSVLKVRGDVIRFDTPAVSGDKNGKKEGPR